MFINISLRILGATMFPFMSSMIYLFFMFFSDMMEPIFFMNEFFATHDILQLHDGVHVLRVLSVLHSSQIFRHTDHTHSFYGVKGPLITFQDVLNIDVA